MKLGCCLVKALPATPCEYSDDRDIRKLIILNKTHACTSRHIHNVVTVIALLTLLALCMYNET